MDQAKRSQSAMKYSVNQSSSRHDRDSSLELLKIIAMIAIVCSHVVQSLLPNELGGGCTLLRFQLIVLTIGWLLWIHRCGCWCA